MSNPLDQFDAENQDQGAFNMNELGNLFQGMQEQGIDPMMLLQSMMSGMGEGEEGEQFMDMMNQFMSAINPEEIAKASTTQMIEMYETFLAEEKDTLPEAEFNKYKEQLDLHKEILVLFENKASEEEFQEVSTRMNWAPEELPPPIRAQLESSAAQMGPGGEGGGDPCGPQ